MKTVGAYEKFTPTGGPNLLWMILAVLFGVQLAPSVQASALQ